MNNRLRKRFLGAGVVVALAALILPFLMQGEGYKVNRQLAEDAKTRIPERPAKPASLDTRVPEPPEDVRAALVEPDNLPDPASELTPEPASPAASKPAATELAKPKPAPPVPAKPVAEVKVKPLDKPAEKPVANLPSKPQDVAASKAQEKTAEKAVSPSANKLAEPVAPKAAEAWVVQLGSFTAESNAQTLLAQVQRAGVGASVERIEVKGSPVWRVVSGRYATRAEADAALKLLKTRLNLGGMVRPVR